jgi:hypothetical protein
MKTTGEPTNGDPDVIEENNASKPEVARVSVRLPTFWAKRPSSWFAQAEAQFHLAGITNERTQFYHVISQLDENPCGSIPQVPATKTDWPIDRLSQHNFNVKSERYAASLQSVLDSDSGW